MVSFSDPLIAVISKSIFDLKDLFLEKCRYHHLILELAKKDFNYVKIQSIVSKCFDHFYTPILLIFITII